MLLLYCPRNPNYPRPVQVTYPQYNTTTKAYLVLDKDMGLDSEKHLLAARATDFWLQIVPLLQVSDGEEQTNCDTSGTKRNAVAVVYLFAGIIASFFKLMV